MFDIIQISKGHTNLGTFLMAISFSLVFTKKKILFFTHEFVSIHLSSILVFSDGSHTKLAGSQSHICNCPKSHQMFKLK